MLTEFDLKNLKGLQEAYERAGCVIVRNVLPSDLIDVLDFCISHWPGHCSICIEQLTGNCHCAHDSELPGLESRTNQPD